MTPKETQQSHSTNPNLSGLMASLERSSANAREKALQEKIDFLLSELAQHKDALDLTLLLKESAEKPIPSILPKLKSGRSESVAVALASDWHVEEEVRADRVHGRNEFNLQVADKRIAKFFQNVVKLVDLMRGGTQIDTLVLALLGDLITGYIHEELVETNACSPTEACLWVLERLRVGLKYLADHGNFKRIIVPCCVGNHGRTTIKMRQKTSATNSYEWFLYQVLKLVAPDERFEFVIGAGYHIYLSVYDYTLRMHHGEKIKYDGGIGGPTIPILKAIAGWNRETPATIDCFGHLHQSLTHPQFVLNSALIGYSEFAVAIKAPYEPPTQTLFLMEKDRGRTITTPIFLDRV